MIFKKKNKLQKMADAAIYTFKAKISELDGRKALMYGGLGIVAIYGITKLSTIGKIALPLLAVAAPRYIGPLTNRLQKLIKMA